MFDPGDIPQYPSWDDDLEGRPLRYLTHRDLSHPSAAEWPDWSTWQKVLARCYGQGLQADAAVGQVLGRLESLGLADNSVVIWVADHGDAVASHGKLWDKASTYTEEVARVPLAIRWPGSVPAGSRIQQLVSNMDTTATMLDAAGIEVPAEMDSRSLLPLCRDAGSAEWPDQVICEHYGHGHIRPQRIIFQDQFKYVAALFDGDELYDLESDPYEMNNLIDAAEWAEVRDDLRERLIARLESETAGSNPIVRMGVSNLLVALRNGR